jgi:hypothetical protein
MANRREATAYYEARHPVIGSWHGAALHQKTRGVNHWYVNAGSIFQNAVESCQELSADGLTFAQIERRSLAAMSAGA